MYEKINKPNQTVLHFAIYILFGLVCKLQTTQTVDEVSGVRLKFCTYQNLHTTQTEK